MKPRTWRDRWRGCVLGILVLMGALLVGGTYLRLYVDYSGPTLVQPSGDRESPTQAPYTLSAEQQRTIDELGYPESFTLLFYQEVEEGGGIYDIRFECWEFGASGREIVFVNGEKISDAPSDGLGQTPVAAPFRPEQFAASMRLNEVLASAGISEYARAAADPALLASGEVYLASRLAFGMKAGRLMAVETLPIESEG